MQVNISNIDSQIDTLSVCIWIILSIEITDITPLDRGSSGQNWENYYYLNIWSRVIATYDSHNFHIQVIQNFYFKKNFIQDFILFGCFVTLFITRMYSWSYDYDAFSNYSTLEIKSALVCMRESIWASNAHHWIE